MLNTNVHEVKEISLSDISRKEIEGDAFCSRRLMITTAKGVYEIVLFSDDGYALLISDDELASMTSPALMAA